MLEKFKYDLEKILAKRMEKNKNSLNNVKYKVKIKIYKN